MDYIIKLLRSKNPFLVTVGTLFAVGFLLWGAFVMTAKANEYLARYETKDEHTLDVNQKVELFKKDVRIAMLENNKVLLDEIDKRMRRRAD